MEHDNETIDPEGFFLVRDNWNPIFTLFSGKVKWPGGTKAWYKNGNLHRTDGPAVVRSSGDKFWYKEGYLHREDNPAAEFVDGRIEWWYKGVHGLENFPPELKKKLTRKFIHGT